MRVLRYGVIAAALVILAGLLMASLGDREQEVGLLPAGEIAMGDVSQKVWKVRLISLQGPVETLRLEAETAEVGSHGRDLSLQQIRISWVPEKGLPLTVEGESGILNMTSRALHLEGRTKPLEIVLGNRYRMETMSLNWDEAAQEVRSSEKVVFQADRAVIEGHGFVGRIDRGEYEIQQPVRAELDL